MGWAKSPSINLSCRKKDLQYSLCKNEKSPLSFAHSFPKSDAYVLFKIQVHKQKQLNLEIKQAPVLVRHRLYSYGESSTEQLSSQYKSWGLNAVFRHYVNTSVTSLAPLHA